MPRDRGVSVDPIASRVWLAHLDGRTYTDIARQAGYRSHNSGSLMCKALGLQWQTSVHYYDRKKYRNRYKAKTIGYDKALAIARAIHIDPVDIGL